MAITIHDVEQGSTDWEELRLGIPTASCFDNIVTPAKLELSKSSLPYMCKLIAEWITGAPLEAYESPWQKRGKELEAEAVRFYELERSIDTAVVGFVTNDLNREWPEGMLGAGCSPDRFVGDDGLLEQKCPSPAVHVGYMLDPATLLAEYRMQTQGQLWVCDGREWCDLQSYCPPFPSVVVRAYREEKVKAAFDKHIPAFIDVMIEARARLVQQYGDDLRQVRDVGDDRLEASRAAFDAFMSSPLGGVV